MPNALKSDPTRTTTLRRKFVADMTRRFRALSKNINELVVEDDAFGLTASSPFLGNQQVARQAWRFQSDAQKVASYRAWLKGQIDQGILVRQGATGQPWTDVYIESAYRKGVARAYTDTRRDLLATEPQVFEQTKADFLRQTFNQPVAIQKLELLGTRAFDQLEGVTQAMSQQMSRILSDGLSAGDGAAKIARDLRNNVEKINNTRAKVLARTEIVHAHAEGQLDAFERLGVKELGILAEWQTAGDERVCPECEPLDGVVMTVDEARGLLPRHPNCRCAWVPANRKFKEPGQKRGRKADAAVSDSIQAEAGKNTIRRTKRQTRRRSVWRGKELL